MIRGFEVISKWFAKFWIILFRHKSVLDLYLSFDVSETSIRISFCCFEFLYFI